MGAQRRTPTRRPDGPPLAPLLDDPHAGTNGFQVSLAGTITVSEIEADVLFGDTN